MKQRKALIVTTSEPNLEEALQEKCIRQPDEHEMIQGNETQRSEQYPKKFVRRFIAVLDGRKLGAKEDVTGDESESDERMDGETSRRTDESEAEVGAEGEGTGGIEGIEETRM